MKKKMNFSKCVGCGEMFRSEKKMAGILKMKEKRCEECRGDGDDCKSVGSTGSSRSSNSVRADIVTVDSRDDDNN